jgi:hypothetical protein
MISSSTRSKFRRSIAARASNPVGRLLDLVDAEALQPAHQQVPVLRHIVDDQHRGGRRVHAGTRSAHPAASARMSMSIIIRAGALLQSVGWMDQRLVRENREPRRLLRRIGTP